MRPTLSTIDSLTPGRYARPSRRPRGRLAVTFLTRYATCGGIDAVETPPCVGFAELGSTTPELLSFGSIDRQVNDVTMYAELRIGTISSCQLLAKSSTASASFVPVPSSAR